MNTKAKNFDIFVREENERRFGVAIKRGFSWPGFLFSFFWAFANRLWLKAVILTFLINLVNAFWLAYSHDHPFAFLFAQVANLCIVIFVGIKGNDWRRQYVIAKKFKLEKSVLANSPKGALDDSEIAPANSLGYALKTFAAGSLSSAVCFFVLLVFFVSWAHGDENYAIKLIPSISMFGLVGLSLILRAYFPPVRWYSALSIVLGGLLIGSAVTTCLVANASVLIELPQLLVGLLLLTVGFWAVIAGRRGKHANARGRTAEREESSVHHEKNSLLDIDQST